tara:strand:- start:3457 stop:4413 length:957 start_codon:yes stop_codon:yes gene_type:complete
MIRRFFLSTIIVFVMFLLALYLFLNYYYFFIPEKPVKLEMKERKEESLELIDYGKTPVFIENLRFDHNNISFFIKPPCSNIRKSNIRNAFIIFGEKFKIIKFKETFSINADILIECPNKEIIIGGSNFAAGEGGPYKIINTTKFRIIKEGRIFLYKDEQCKTPIVGIHEIGHVFGFNHSLNKKSIMYNTTRCDQKITPDMVEIINNLYSIKPLPDATIYNISSVKKGRYLDFNITLVNEGLTLIENISLTISSENKEIEKIYFGEIDVGYARTLRATNMALPSRNLKTIEFTIDKEKNVIELDEKNNFAEMIIASSRS